MPRKIFFSIAIFLSCASVAFCQLDDSLFQRSQEIVYDSIKNAGELKSSAHIALARSRLLPQEQTKKFLLKCLDAEDQQLQIYAADILLEKSENQFKEAVVSVLNDLETDQPDIVIQRTRLLATLGDDDAVEQFNQWHQQILAKKPLQIPGIETHEWICPMVCAKPEKHSGRCPVCEMELVQRAKSVSGDWHFKIAVIRSLKLLGKDIEDHVQIVLASDADAFSRMSAAEQWVTEDRSAGLPHLKLFLHSDYRDFVIAILADVAPRESGDVFAAALNEPKNSFVKFDAWRGQIRGGKVDVLDEVRRIVDAPAENENEKAQKAHAIAILAEFASSKDSERIQKILEGEYAVIAAESLLKRRIRKNSRERSTR